MRYITDRKRAVGLGSAKTGAQEFWKVRLTSAGLFVLVPLFVFTFGPMLGEPHDEVIAYFARPFPAIVAALTIVVGFKHFRDGAQVMIEDYVHGTTETLAIIAVTIISYGAMATGLFAIARIAL